MQILGDADISHEDSYDDYLPASIRTQEDDLASPTLTTNFLREEFSVKRLNDIHRWLWMVGRPVPPQPLHHHKALGRTLMVHEQADLHLVWDEERIFLKPVPQYILDEKFWHDVLSCRDGCQISHSSSSQKGNTKIGMSQNLGLEKHTPRDCGICELRALVLGLLHSYIALISHESDFRLAQSHALLPSTLSYPQWRSFARSILSSPDSSPKSAKNVNPRYHYGNLRLSRLNAIYILTFRSPLRGYAPNYTTYSSFWSANTKRIAGLFAYLVLVLTAMQVGLATQRGMGSDMFDKICWVVAVLCIVAPVGLVVGIGAVFVGVLVANWVVARRFWRWRMRWIEKSMDASMD